MSAADSRVKRISTKSVFKFSLTLALVIILVQLIAFSVIYLVLYIFGVFDSVFPVVQDLFRVTLNFKTLLPYLLGVAVFNSTVVVFTMMCSTILFNLVSVLTGGLKVRLQTEE